MQRFIFLILLIFLFSCSSKNENSSSCDDDLFCPYETDKECISEVAKAKQSIKKGEIYFCIHHGMMGYDRYEGFIDEVCKLYKLKVTTALSSDLVYENITENCFCVYMDAYIEKKFGDDFREMIEKKADSLYSLSLKNDTIEEWNCDIRFEPDTLYELIQSKINYKGITIERYDNELPFLDCDFVIDTVGVLRLFGFNWLDSLGLDSKEILNLEAQFRKVAREIKTNFRCQVISTTTSTWFNLHFFFDPPGENDPLFIRCEERDLNEDAKLEDQGYLFDNDFFELKNGKLTDPDYASGVVVDQFRKTKLDATTFIIECDRQFGKYIEGKDHFYFLVKKRKGIYYQICQASFPVQKLKSSAIEDNMIMITDDNGAISMIQITTEGFLFGKKIFIK